VIFWHSFCYLRCEAFVSYVQVVINLKAEFVTNQLIKNVNSELMRSQVFGGRGSRFDALQSGLPGSVAVYACSFYAIGGCVQ